MPQGWIVKALSGYYYVLPEQANLHTKAVIQCRARGVFKKRGISPLVGDQVIYELTENGEGTVTEVLPRTSELIRPPMANAKLAVLVFSVTEPALNLQLLDKFLVHVAHSGLDALLCFTKYDLLDFNSSEQNEELKSKLHQVFQLYETIGYEVVITSAKRKQGIEEVSKRLANTISVFSGQSGVGKSSLLNAMNSNLDIETNAISMKLGRGKHTTRHVELWPLENGGFVADTPGFSQLDFMEIEVEELSSCFKEFAAVAEGCRFRGCLHLHEPDCKVRDGSTEGNIAPSRYENYLTFLHEMKNRKKRY
ncbi:ribosome small subunit-dependent GTPase A [Paenibacillus eucommiae]|uniref:Small ribosomal subunit biogenesis GTPase RsgA n=1 Tax=Paenibacillus eucommiae TaxID=1355755 RepID=A0ABS4IV23_9BACL|nr:ribosome small subunit-dependent GTPase A [Paenibacillus eucommiae]MBP1991430.1 ribosome biogenesis GTPase [Paenibacillus eucommiae]